MKIAICDDSRNDLEHIRRLTDELIKQLDAELEAHYFSSAEELIDFAKKSGGLSLAVFDIYMNGADGLSAARELRGLFPSVHTAFLTSSTDHALEAFDLNAVHYIIKPVTAEKLTELFERFFTRIRSPFKNFELKSRTKTYAFPLSQVLKVQSSNKGVDVYLKNGASPVHIPLAFASIETQLDPGTFLKISRGLIVNMSYILCIDKNVCRFRDGTETLISRHEKDDVRRRYNDYLFVSQGAV